MGEQWIRENASPWERKGIGSRGNTGRFSVGLAATNDEAEPITGQRRIRSLSRSGKTTEKENGARKEKSRTNSFLVIFCFIQLPLFGGGRWGEGGGIVHTVSEEHNR